MFKKLELVGLIFGEWRVTGEIAEKNFICKSDSGKFKIMSEAEILRYYLAGGKYERQSIFKAKGYSKLRDNYYIVRFKGQHMGCRKTEEEARALYLATHIKYFKEYCDKELAKELKQILDTHANKFTKNDIEYYTDLINKYTV